MDGNSHTPRRHIGIRLLIVIEWLFVLWLLLEFLEAGRAFVAARAYSDYSHAQNLKVYRMVPAEELDTAENKFIEQPRHEPSTGTLVGAATGDGAQVDENNLDMVLRGEMRAMFDEHGALLESYGEPLIEQDMHRFLRGLPADGIWGELIQAIREGKQRLTTRCTLTLGTPVHYEISLERTADGPYVVMATDINEKMPLAALHYAEVPGPESPWEIMFYRYKRNWSIPDNTMLQTNEYGFRDHAIAVPKPEGVYRIVCIGGSTTEEGNTTDTTYPKITERKLAEWFGKGKIEVINAGTCGTNTYNMRRRFQDFLALQPDLIVFYGGVNDTMHLHSQFWLNAVPKWKKWARLSFVLKGYLGFYLLPAEEDLKTYMRDTTYRNLLAMRHAAQKQGVEMAWCSFAYPTLKWHDIRAKNYYDVNMRDVWHGQGLINFRTYCRIMDVFNHTGSEIAEKEGIPWLPVAEHFKAGPDHFFDICHMTPVGLELKTNIFTGLLTAYLDGQGIHPLEADLKR